MDQSINTWIGDHHYPNINTIMEFITKIGSGEFIFFLILMIAVFLFVKRWWWHLTFLLTVSLGGMILNLLLKIFYQRERPGEARELEVFGYSLEIASYSFPSGHTMRSVLLFLVLIFLFTQFIKNKYIKVLWIGLFTMIPILVAVSRIVINAHFFTDVLGAVLISIVWFQLCLIVFHRRLVMSRTLLN